MEQHHLIDKPSGRHVSVAPQPYSHCIFLLSDPGCVRICMGQLCHCKLPTRQRAIPEWFSFAIVLTLLREETEMNFEGLGKVVEISKSLFNELLISEQSDACSSGPDADNEFQICQSHRFEIVTTWFRSGDFVQSGLEEGAQLGFEVVLSAGG